MGTKMADAFANIFMSVVQTEILNFSKTKPVEWKRYIDDIFSLWRTERKEIDELIVLANRHHPSIKFTAEIPDKEINFLDTNNCLQRREISQLRNPWHPHTFWHLIQDQPLLREIYNETPIIAYKRAKSLGDILVRAKL